MSQTDNARVDQVYVLRYWSEDEERPRIDFQIPANGSQVPWMLIGEILEGNLTSDLYMSVGFVVDDTEHAGKKEHRRVATG